VSAGYQRNESFSDATGSAIREGQQRHQVSQPPVLPAGGTLSGNESWPTPRAVERQHAQAPALPGVLNTLLHDGRIAVPHWFGLVVHRVHP
jgi:hypothetical protein